MTTEANYEPVHTEAMDQLMLAGIARLRDDLSSQMDTELHLRRVRELADPGHIALQVGHGASTLSS
ncbi:hypothetical protein ACWGN5_25930 [Streptomyces sp. NPDC055815]